MSLKFGKKYKSKETFIFIDGFQCNCERVFPSIHCFPPFVPAPNRCQNCGTKRKDMENKAIKQIRWTTGRFFKTDWVRYSI